MRLTLERSFFLKPSDMLIPSSIDPTLAAGYIRAPHRSERWEYLCFRGKASKPVVHYSIKTKEQAEAEVARFYEQEARNLAWKAERREAQKIERQKSKAEFAGIPGSVFVQSWGWEQTNITAFQMVRRISASTIEAVEISLEVDGKEWAGAMSDHVKPCPISQAEAEADPEKIIMRISGTESVLVPRTEGYSWGRNAQLWDGKRAFYRSWYA